MKNLIYLLLILWFCFPNNVLGVIWWDKTFGGADYDYGYSVAACSDGGYIITGYTYSYSSWDGDGFLIKTDDFGNKIWDKYFERSCGNSVAVCNDGGFIITGTTSSEENGSDAWLIKTDAEGNMLWDNTFGGTEYDIGNSVAVCSDGGYIIVGTTRSYAASGNDDIWLIKTDEYGNMQWDRIFGGTNFESGNSVAVCNDSGYIITGYTYSYGAGERDVWLIKTGPLGWKQWDKTFGGTGGDYGSSVAVCSDGGYIITGETTGDLWLIKTDEYGNKKWDKTFGGGCDSDSGYSVAVCNDGGYIITGVTYSFDIGFGDIWLIKTDEYGNKQWDKTFGGGSRDIGYSLATCNDGGYIITGITYIDYDTGYDVKLIYFNPELGVNIDEYTLDLSYPAGGNCSAKEHQLNFSIGNCPGSIIWSSSNENVATVSRSGYVTAQYVGSAVITAECSTDPNCYDEVIVNVKLCSIYGWSKTFGEFGQDRGYSLQQTSDGGYIITGMGDVCGYGLIWLIKTDPEGNLQWDKYFCFTNHNYSYSVQQTSDGGYIITGEIIDDWWKNGDVLLLKTDPDGNEQWHKNFGEIKDDDLGNSVKQTSDGGFIIAGMTQPYGSSNADVWLIKTDQSGNLQWDRTIGGSGNDQGKSLFQTSDGGYIITGWTSNAGNFDVWLIKTGPLGWTQWSKTFGGSNKDLGNSVQQTTDGGYIITGMTASFGSDTEDVWLIKTDAEGNLQWEKTFDRYYNDWGNSVQQTTDGGYIITGVTSSLGFGLKEIWLIKTDEYGNLQWDETFGGTGNDSGNSVQQTLDGGYILTGSYDNGEDTDVWLIYYNPENVNPIALSDLNLFFAFLIILFLVGIILSYKTIKNPN